MWIIAIIIIIDSLKLTKRPPLTLWSVTGVSNHLSSMYRINADLILNSRAFYNPMKERQIDLRGMFRLDGLF